MIARRVAFAEFAVEAHAPLFVFAETLSHIDRWLDAAVAKPSQTQIAVAFITGFFGFNIHR